MNSFLPTIEESRDFFAQVDQRLQAPDWFLCNQKGCCDGNADCCRHSLQAMLTWIEMELIWSRIQDWTPADRRSLAKKAKDQVNAIRAASPELFDSVDDRERLDRDTIGKVTEAIGKVDHVCPLLGDNNLCTVYDSRPLICRGFGQAARVKMNENGQPEGQMMSCSANHAHMKQRDPDFEIPNFDVFERELYELAAPRVKFSRTALIVKPLQFWLMDLMDDSGDLTNPNDLFTSIRMFIDTGMNQGISPKVE